MKVYTDSANPLLWRVLVAAKYANVALEQQIGVDPNSKDVLAKSPFGKVPFLETDKGCIFEANAIVRYLARLGKGSLYGSNDNEAGQVDQFIDFAASEIELPGNVWVFPILGYIPNNSVATQKAKGDIRKALDFLNKHLNTKTFLVGERISIADIVVSLSLYYLYQRVLDTAFRKQFVNTNRWFLTCVNQPEFKSIIGEVKLADKMEVAAEVAESKEQEKPKKEEKKQEKPKKEEKPKEEKPKKEAPPKDDDMDDEDAEKQEKKKNPLDDLPPSKFVMDEWKRVYSNTKEIRKDAATWFWNNFDKEGYSLWFCDYKYNNELEKVFMTCNFVGGFIQRLDPLRKYAFGSLLIFGNDPKLEIHGCFLFRGKDLPPQSKEIDDFELYDWKKVNIDDAAQREKANDFFAWDGSFGGLGLPFNQGKTFK
jgi:elongation factor 1-gamma